VNINGTLGLTGAYGLGDPSLTRSRVEADLGVLREYQTRFTGMMEDCKQKLNRSVEQYANIHKFLPQPPELLELQDDDSAKWLLISLGLILGMRIAIIIVLVILAIPMSFFIDGLTVTIYGIHSRYPNHSVDILQGIASFLSLAPSVVCILYSLFTFIRTNVANGNRPAENARRKNAYEREMAAAMREAERKKAAEDHRLRVQIRELEGEIKAVSEKMAGVRRILATV
jgi:hypothetical protein